MIKENEVSDGLPQSSGGTINPKVEDIAQDVLLASKTYSAALGRSRGSDEEHDDPKPRWAEMAPSVHGEEDCEEHEEPLDSAAEAAKDEAAIKQSLANLDQVVELVRDFLSFP